MVCKLCPTRKHCWDKGNCEDCDFGKAFESLNKKITKLKSEVAELTDKLECLLCHATGSKLSKSTYPIRIMETAVNDYIQESCDESCDEAIKEVAREIFSDLDRILEAHTTEQHYKGERFVPKTIDIGIEKAIAELKKKYIGDKEK